MSEEARPVNITTATHALTSMAHANPRRDWSGQDCTTFSAFPAKSAGQTRNASRIALLAVAGSVPSVRWPFDRRVDPAHARGVIAVGTAVLVGIPAVLATLHAANSQFRWWWPTDWMTAPSIIFVGGCLLVAIPVRRFSGPGDARPGRYPV